MKRLLKSLIFIAWLGIAHAGTQQISLKDILFLAERGVSDETMLVFLESREVGFIPDAEDIDKLLSAVVSEEVIRYLLRQTATNTTNSTPSYSYRTITYEDLYPAYYYTPYYSGGSGFFGYSSYPHTWYGSHYGGVHYTSLHHGATHSQGYNDHGTLSLSHTVHRGGGHIGSHASRYGRGHNVAVGIRHGGSRHTVAHEGRQSVGHSRRSPAHRSGGVHSRSQHGGGHSGGHGGGHGGGH